MLKRAAILAVGLVMSAPLAEASQEPIWDGNKVELELKDLGNQAYALIPSGADEMAEKGYPVATTSGFVVGDKGVLVIDTMLNERLANQVMSAIRSKTDKPVRYIVNTSYHGDHSYGNHYFPASATVIQHAATAGYIAKHFKADTQFMMQHFGKGRGIEEVKPRAADILIPTGGRLSLDLGGRTVDIRDFGFAQTGGDLFVWVPDANTMWTGNPVIAPKPALPWLLDGHLVETLASMRAVHAFLPKDAVVVPGHGPITDKSAIQWHIDYLDAVQANVKSAIAKGLTLKQTVKAVAMKDFAGYALFGWVHPGLNIPAAYKDLSKN